MSKQFNIGVLTKFIGNFYHGAIIQSLQHYLSYYNAKLFIFDTFMIYRFLQEKNHELFFSNISSNTIDGWMILSEGSSFELANIFSNCNKPLITVGCKIDNINCCSIVENGRKCAEDIVDHLIEHGHKRIVYIGNINIFDMYERYEGYRDSLEKHNIPFDNDLCILIQYFDVNLTPLGKNSIKTLIEKKIEFSAIFAASDVIALGCIDALKEFGYKIPEDVAIIGYDDSIYAKNYIDGLSTAKQDLDGMAKIAVDNIINSLKENKPLLPKTIYTNSSLVKRKSCGCAASNFEEQSFPNNIIFKNNVINYLQKEMGKNYDIASAFNINNIYEINNIVPKIVNRYSSQCISFFNDQGQLYTHDIFDVIKKTHTKIDSIVNIDDIPIKEFRHYISNSNTEDIIWVIPISTKVKNWCIITFISPFNPTNIILYYDSSALLLNLLGVLLDHNETNIRLHSILDTLKETQDQLIQSEKLISLGRIVAGVAHEINTPLGVSVTAASILKELSTKISEMVSSGNITKSGLKKFIDTNNETADILLINLRKASDLINSFKQVAVDQSVEEKRLINVKTYLNEILLSLSPNIKNNKIHVEVSCLDNLEIYNYPGGLSQIITNLIMNSILHGFENRQIGTIKINVYIDSQILNIIFSDNGNGIKKENLSKIFDPFFTTKRGFGGTGLGLNIVFNLVTQQYSGSIVCESEEEVGTTFKIKIPL